MYDIIKPMMKNQSKRTANNISNQSDSKFIPSLFSNRAGNPKQNDEQFGHTQGLTSDEVRVHYNSDKLVQLHAINLNTSQQLENATDKFAYNLKNKNDWYEQNFNNNVMDKSVVQRKLIGENSNISDFIYSQSELQKLDQTSIEDKIKKTDKNSKGAFVTVGFEHEFGYYRNEELNNKTHVTIVNSNEEFVFSNNMTFGLETDRNNVIELVTPPFIFMSNNRYPLPLPEDIKIVERMFKEGFTELLNGCPKGLTEIFSGFKDLFHISFVEKKEKGATDFTILNKPLHTQINFTTGLRVYDTMKRVLNQDIKKEKLRADIIGNADKTKLLTYIVDSDYIAGTMNLLSMKFYNLLLDCYKSCIVENKPSKNGDDRIKAILSVLADNMSQTFVIPLLNGKEVDDKFVRTIRTSVKNVNTVWLKDSVVNLARANLTKDEWKIIHDTVSGLIQRTKNVKNNQGIDLLINEWFRPSAGKLKSECIDYEAFYRLEQKKKLTFELCIGKMSEYINNILVPFSNIDMPEMELKNDTPFGTYDEKKSGVRQDTFISPLNIKKSSVFEDNYLSVVEYRYTEGFPELLNGLKSKLVGISEFTMDTDIKTLLSPQDMDKKKEKGISEQDEEKQAEQSAEKFVIDNPYGLSKPIASNIQLNYKRRNINNMRDNKFNPYNSDIAKKLNNSSKKLYYVKPKSIQPNYRPKSLIRPSVRLKKLDNTYKHPYPIKYK